MIQNQNEIAIDNDRYVNKLSAQKYVQAYIEELYLTQCAIINTLLAPTGPQPVLYRI